MGVKMTPTEARVFDAMELGRWMRDYEIGRAANLTNLYVDEAAGKYARQLAKKGLVESNRNRSDPKWVRPIGDPA